MTLEGYLVLMAILMVAILLLLLVISVRALQLVKLVASMHDKLEAWRQGEKGQSE